MLPWENVYEALRAEIVANNVLMHGCTLVVVILLFVGVWLCELRTSILSVLLPLLSVSWAAATVRFDYLIHRQGAYLRLLEEQHHEPLWETWKAGLRSTKFAMPVLDLFAVIPVIAATAYVLFGPCKDYFAQHHWPGATAYSYTVMIALILLLAAIAFVPTIARQ
jgi:hypothetical protein